MELSTWMGVGGCGQFNLFRVVRMGTASLELRKRAPNSTSAAEDIMLRRILQTPWMIPLRRGV